MDVMLLIAMVAFFSLVCAWLVLPASTATAEPSRIVVPRPSAAEA